MIDVLVVGGGPAGLATAIRCAQAGLSVTVAEPRSGPIDKACGEGLMPAAVTRLAALGVHPDGRPLRGIRYRDADHCADAPFRQGHGLGVRRTVLHAALAARARELDIPVRAVRVTGLVQQFDRVTAAGIEARYLVGADGLHSTVRRSCALEPAPARHRRFGLRRHYRLAPWTDFVEVHWSPGAEAYVTPVADDLVGVAILASPVGNGGLSADGSAVGNGNGSGVGTDSAVSNGNGNGNGNGSGSGDGGGSGFASRLAAFPELVQRLAGAEPASELRGAGPLRQDVRCRVAGRVLLVGDASGYLDALTGEGIGVALAQAQALASCLAADRPEEYEREWRRASRRAWILTSGLLWARHQALLAPRIVPAAQRLPWLFTSIVNQVGQA